VARDRSGVFSNQPSAVMTDPESVERHLSVERLGRYRRAASGGLAAALRLYEWNSAGARR